MYSVVTVQRNHRNTIWNWSMLRRIIGNVRRISWNTKLSPHIFKAIQRNCYFVADIGISLFAVIHRAIFCYLAHSELLLLLRFGMCVQQFWWHCYSQDKLACSYGIFLIKMLSFHWTVPHNGSSIHRFLLQHFSVDSLNVDFLFNLFSLNSFAACHFTESLNDVKICIYGTFAW